MFLNPRRVRWLTSRCSIVRENRWEHNASTVRRILFYDIGNPSRGLPTWVKFNIHGNDYSKTLSTKLTRNNFPRNWPLLRVRYFCVGNNSLTLTTTTQSRKHFVRRRTPQDTDATSKMAHSRRHHEWQLGLHRIGFGAYGGEPRCLLPECFRTLSSQCETQLPAAQESATLGTQTS